MNENNSPSNEENQEPESVPPSNPTIEPHSGDDSPSNEENQESTTEPPPAQSHGWLEQFDAFEHAAFEELESVAALGLEKFEGEMLTQLAFKLTVLANNHHPGLAQELIDNLVRVNYAK